MTSLTARRSRVAGEGWGVRTWLGVALPDHRSFPVVRRHLDVYRELLFLNLVLAVSEPTLALLVMGLALGRFVELAADVEYIVFVAPGVMAMFAMFATVGETLWGGYLRLAQQDTYGAMLATPARAEDIAAGEIIWGALRAVITVVAVLVVLAVLTPAWDILLSPLVILALPVAFLMGMLFSAISIAYIGYARSMHHLMYYFTIVINPMFWFSGAFFPLNELPGWAVTLGWFNPLAHVVDIFRGLMLGDVGWSHAGDVLWLAVVTPPLCWLAIWSIRRRLIR
ncbi:MAG: lipooligosaccharide transport system permease protein [Chloroflexi bacterium]|nr:MAG: lipooligosaccharide transport system permease protein [Chloroflexota bacterium]